MVSIWDYATIKIGPIAFCRRGSAARNNRGGGPHTARSMPPPRSRVFDDESDFPHTPPGIALGNSESMMSGEGGKDGEGGEAFDWNVLAPRILRPVDIQAKYNPDAVAQAILVEVLDLHPERLTVSGWLLRIVADPDDGIEVETATEAIHGLRASGLIDYRNDDRVVEATYAALRASELLMGTATRHSQASSLGPG
jgi:hypothetical protein